MTPEERARKIAQEYGLGPGAEALIAEQIAEAEAFARQSCIEVAQDEISRAEIAKMDATRQGAEVSEAYWSGVVQGAINVREGIQELGRG